MVFVALLLGAWAASTSLLLYRLPKLIINRIAETQIEQAGALDRWLHKRTTVDHTFRDVVRPNVDCVYSSVFADLTSEPYVVEAPPMDKYWSFGFYSDNTTNFKTVSIRTHGTRKKIKALLVPEGYDGETMGFEVVESPSDLVWIIARLRVEGHHDEPRIRNIQDQMRFLPLSEYRATSAIPHDDR